MADGHATVAGEADIESVVRGLVLNLVLLGVVASVASAEPATGPATQPVVATVPTSAPSTTSRTGGREPIRIVRTPSPPTIDGRLDDAVWQDAAIIEDFSQVEPVEGGPPSERTQVRLLYDADALYIGIRCFDSEPSKIIGKQMARDGGLGSDDVVSLAIDTFHDHRNGYAFETGPAGARRDGSIEQGGRVRWEWDGIWFVKTSRDDLGWVVEMLIPAKTLAFDADSDTWGFNIARTIRRKQEVVRWAGARQNLSVRNIAEAGNLTGIEGLRQGLGLTFKPFLATDIDLSDGSSQWKPGFDTFYRISPSVTAALTVNTDFAEAEADQRVVNLTRFPLFFPEKRDFFLQDSGIFSFGGLGWSPLPFHSRTIGIVDGETKDILAGLKLTGREGASSFGVLNVQMAEDDELGNKNLTVARGAYNVLEESTIGAIFTYGDPDAPSNDNALGGVDANFRTSRYKGDKVVEAHAWAMGTESANEEVDPDAAFGVSASYPNEPISAWASAEQIGQDLDPGLGFVSRTGVRNYNGGAGYNWSPEGYIRDVGLSVGGGLTTDLDGQPLDAGGSVPSFFISNEHGDAMSAALQPQWENLEEPFEIQPGIIVPADEYSTGELDLSAWTSDARPLSVGLGYQPGTFYTGTRQDYFGGLTWRPSPMFRGMLEYEINDVDLEEGSFDVHIVRVRADFYFSPAVSWSNLVQWDNISHEVGVNSRFRWELEPGRDLFVVLNQGMELDDGELHTINSILSMKVGLTFRF
jgi:hypothetical protein